MPADPRQTARLRELHRAFAWKVNAAIAAGRVDVIDALCEEYADEAVRVLTARPPAPPGPAGPAAVTGARGRRKGRASRVHRWWWGLLGCARARGPSARR